MPVQAPAALQVLQIIEEDELLVNVTKQGTYLGMSLKAALGGHPLETLEDRVFSGV
jgi:4-aminobutyrate aminotransferase-like enzyme